MASTAHHPAPTSRLRVTLADQVREYADPMVAVGRDPALPVPIAHPDVSRRHAEFRRTAQGWYLVDLQSTNGTWLGAQRVSHELLTPGNAVTVALGGVHGPQLHVEVLAAPAWAPPPPQRAPRAEPPTVRAASAPTGQLPPAPSYPQAPPGQLAHGHTVIPSGQRTQPEPDLDSLYGHTPAQFLLDLGMLAVLLLVSLGAARVLVLRSAIRRA